MSGTRKKLTVPYYVLILATGYLILFAILIYFGFDIGIWPILLLTGMILIIWLVYTTIRYGVHDSRELKEDEPFGYEDLNHKTGTYKRSVKDQINQIRKSDTDPDPDPDPGKRGSGN
jgi:fatty acid desaturase